MDAQQIALTRYAQPGVNPIDQGSAFRYRLHDKAFLKKSISTFCCPMACISRSFSNSASLFSPPLLFFENTDSAPSRNSFFQALICTGCRSNFWANSGQALTLL